ncbi:uncharacterized protein LOC100142219 [Tribolium castaneum]|uniref:G-protein coupled receptors family 1 profile domain-containing protein n=1 Tax=Tribolium castaneum TaxID=7070 RepID=A0A139WC10_TRICA|nr:uncharacterized protein LOC100142219 [Tribolium castaneum]KYB25436.1 hypothetical protein TcasGA2_TC034475 [Tribolium castaneum]|eukprot:NP_001155992.1 uncharacterized protein LOC100142219 [Tribolium castaneum]
MEAFDNITGNFTDELVEPEVPPYDRIFLELFTLVAFLSATANTLLIFTIIKYKKLRENATNVIFLHVNISQAGFLLSTPLIFRTFLYFFDKSVHLTVFCAFYQLTACVGSAIAGFLFLLICDSYLKIYHKEKYRKFCRILKYFIIAIYVLTILTSSVTLHVCFNSYMYAFTHIFFFFAICCVFIALIVVNLVHAFRKRRVNYKDSNIGLVVANAFFLLWTPAVIFVVLSKNGIVFAGLIVFILFFALGLTSPIFNLVYVYCCDNNFNVFLRQVFTCRCKDYKNEDLEDQPVVYNDVNGVRINSS